MDHVSRLKADKIKHPATHYKTPENILEDKELSSEEKKEALNTWEQDARQLLSASNEGMPGSEEGVHRDDHHRRIGTAMIAGPIFNGSARFSVSRSLHLLT